MLRYPVNFIGAFHLFILSWCVFNAGYIWSQCLTWTYFQALLHASTACKKKLVVDWIPSSDLEDSTTLEVCLMLINFSCFYHQFDMTGLLLRAGTWTSQGSMETVEGENNSPFYHMILDAQDNLKCQTFSCLNHQILSIA